MCQLVEQSVRELHATEDCMQAQPFQLAWYAVAVLGTGLMITKISGLLIEEKVLHPELECRQGW